ncbi:MAG TPA: FtsQ-type POTRA domain-containing protein [Prosthecobacter sp.]|nr:FtsQ-type POTRA domain-containing protein [Prosthecobacter sp.]
MPAFHGSPKKKKSLPASRRKDGPLVSHDVDLKADSPKIREMEKSAAKRRGFRAGVIIITLICLLALLKITVREAFLQNPQFALRQIAVRTEGPLTAEKIVRTTALTEGTNLLTINLREVRTRLERLPQIHSIKIERDYSGLLTLDVKQRLPVAWLECAKLGMVAGKKGAAHLVDAEGVFFPGETEDRDYHLLPLIRYEGLPQNSPGTRVQDLPLTAALRLLGELQKRFEQGTEEVRVIDIQTPYSMTALFADKSQVTFGVDDLDLQLTRLDRVRQEARQRQWQIETLNLLVRQNVPVTFRQPPDLAGLQDLKTPIATLPRPPSRTSR